MIRLSTIICCVISLLVCLVLPVVILLVFAVKNKKQGIVSAWLLGAAGFFVTQILIRVPILTALQSQPWFLSFYQKHLFVYAFGLAFTAGLFELAGRFAVAKLMQKRLTFKRSLAAGLGHGGIEAMVLIGMTYINNLIYIFMINSGTFDALFAQVGGDPAIIAQLDMIRQQLLSATPALFLLAGFERILAMTAHTAMSMLVCYGVARKKALPCTLVGLAIHTFIDLTAGFSQLAGSVLSQTAVYGIVYAILVIVAAASLYIIRVLHCRWNETEVSYDSEV